MNIKVIRLLAPIHVLYKGVISPLAIVKRTPDGKCATLGYFMKDLAKNRVL